MGGSAVSFNSFVINCCVIDRNVNMDLPSSLLILSNVMNTSTISSCNDRVGADDGGCDGRCEEDTVGRGDGAKLGESDGDPVASVIVGAGEVVGSFEEDSEGASDAKNVGEGLGAQEGATEGHCVGGLVGVAVGATVGVAVGWRWWRDRLAAEWSLLAMAWAPSLVDPLWEGASVGTGASVVGGGGVGLGGIVSVGVNSESVRLDI